MSPLSHVRLLLPLLGAIRDLLGPGECASFGLTNCGTLCIEARTERGSVIATVADDDLLALDTAGGLYYCSPNDTADAIRNAIRRALNDAREEWV